jgi:hypothetical protein
MAITAHTTPTIEEVKASADAAVKSLQAELRELNREVPLRLSCPSL